MFHTTLCLHVIFPVSKFPLYKDSRPVEVQPKVNGLIWAWLSHKDIWYISDISGISLIYLVYLVYPWYPWYIPDISLRYLDYLVKIFGIYQIYQGYKDIPDTSVSKESGCNAGDPGLISRLGRSLGEGKGYPLLYSGLENSMNCTVHGVTKSQTLLSGFHFHFHLIKRASQVTQTAKNPPEMQKTQVRSLNQ